MNTMANNPTITTFCDSVSRKETFRTSWGTILAHKRSALPAEILPDTDMLLPNYRITSKLGDGGYGAVFEAINSDHQKFALKVQEISRRSTMNLRKEFDIYNLLLLNPKDMCQIPGIPRVYEYKEHDGLEYMVMERLGDSLNHIADNSPGKRLFKVDVLMIGIQTVRRLRDLHENGIIHRDVKPENFAMGIGPNSEKTVHIIDFGLAAYVKDWSTYEYDRDVEFAGSYYYASTEALFHKAATRKGDLECLLYALLDLAYGELPWDFIHPETGRKLLDSELGMQRIQSNSKSLCERFPEMADFFEAVKSTRRTEKPDYESLINLLKRALDELNKVNDAEFEWLKTSDTDKYTSRLCPENPSRKDDGLHTVPDTAIENNTKADPVTPPGFGSKPPHIQSENRGIGIASLSANICCAQRVDHAVDGKCIPHVTPTQSVQHDFSNVSIPTHTIQDNGDGVGNLGPLSNLIQAEPETFSSDLPNRHANESETVAPEPASDSSKICIPPRICESSSDFMVMLSFTLAMACYLDCRGERNSARDAIQAQQPMCNNNLKAQKSQEKKKSMARKVSKERNYEEEVGMESEKQDPVMVEQSMMKTRGSKSQDHEVISCEKAGHLQSVNCFCSSQGNGCGGDAPNEAEPRRVRKRAFVKKAVSKGIRRALRVFMVPASMSVRERGIKS